MVALPLKLKNNFGININWNPWILFTWVLSIFLIAPIITLFITASGDSTGLWIHLYETVLLKYILNTVKLMIGVSLAVLILGVSTAWIISRYEFFGSRHFEWLLMLPAACPAYLVAYAYTDFFEYAGPIQESLRNLFEWKSAKDYWFPEIRSIGGAIFVMSSVLYPYVYILARTSFKKSPLSFYEIAKIYNKNSFTSVALPLARPAIVAGLALVCMEVISDFGTVEYFALETLTLGIFNVWLGMNNIAAAAQISIVAFIFIITLLYIEIRSRASQQYSDTTQRQTSIQPIKPSLKINLSCVLICSIPIIFGFILPVLLLIIYSLKTSFHQDWLNLTFITLNTIMAAGAGATIIIILSVFMTISSFYKGGHMTRTIVAAASTGYAFPGTMLSIGVLVFCGIFDDIYVYCINFFSNKPNTGLVSGTLFILLFSYVIRFQAVGYGAMRSGLNQVPSNLIDASLTMGKSFKESLFKVIFPLLKTSILAGGLLAFVDIMKELPMTLLLRPFNFETLSTYTYQFAHDELIEQAALPALLIILAGLLPVIFMNKFLMQNKF